MEFIKPGTKIDFVGMFGIAMTCSGIAILVSLIALFIYPRPRPGIDFSGGTEVHVRFNKDVDMGKVRATMEELKMGDVQVQKFGGGEVGQAYANEYLIRVQKLIQPPQDLGMSKSAPTANPQPAEKSEQPEQKPEDQKQAEPKDPPADPPADESAAKPAEETQAQPAEEAGAKPAEEAPEKPAEKPAAEKKEKAKDKPAPASMTAEAEPDSEAALGRRSAAVIDAKLKEVFGEGSFDIRQINYVGKKAGEEMIWRGVMAIAWSLLLILIYISFRFEFHFGIGAVLSLFHDVIITTGVLILTMKDFNLSTIAALLTIVGYSLNDTIVVYDRIREKTRNKRLGDMRKEDAKYFFNLSINETLSRTILTSSTVLMAVFCLWMFGGGVIHDFSFALLFGVTVGTYSSVFVASAYVLYTKEIQHRLQLSRSGKKE